MTGYYNDATSFKFDTITLSSPGGHYFVVKFNTSGSALWVKSAGVGANQGNAIVADKFGNIYVAGLFDYGPVTFDTISLSWTIGSDIFTLKYNSSGKVVSAKGVGGNHDDYAAAIALDGSNNVYTAGYFKSTSLVFGSTTLTNSDASGNTSDIFLAKQSYPVGIDELFANENSLIIFPNPSNNQFTISFSTMMRNAH